MPIIGCYSLDLYCDHPHSNLERSDCNHKSQAQYCDTTFERCKKQAQNNGWVFYHNGLVGCPQHKKIKAPTESSY